MSKIAYSTAQDSVQPETAPRDHTHLHVGAAAASLGLYLVGALYLLARVIPTFDRSIPGVGVAALDGWQNTWNIWWTHLALSRGQNPYFTNMLFHPTGQSLYLHTLNITNALLTMPVQLVAGPIAAYNTAVILGFVLTGFATYLLAVSLIGRRDIACAVGAIVTFGPFHIAKLADGQLSWITVFWVIFYLWCVLRALDTGSNRWRFFAGIALGGATLTSFYYALFSFIFTGLLILVRLPAAIRGRVWRRELVGVVLIGGIAVALASPVLIPAIIEYRMQPAPNRSADIAPASPWDRETSTYSADLVDIVFPSPFHAWWGAWADQLHQAMHYGWFWTTTPGIGVLALAVIGVALTGRRVWPLAVLVVALWVLMLGPELRVVGLPTGIRLPFDLLRVVPGMTLSHRPSHFAIFMLPLLTVLAGFGMKALLDRGRVGRVVLALLGIVVVIELMVLPMPAQPFDDEPILSELRGQPGAVIELPRLQRNVPPMIHQMVHGRPVVDGYLARPPAKQMITSRVPWVRQLWRIKPERPDDIIEQHPDDARQALSFYDIRTIIVRKNELKPEDNEQLREILDRMLPGSTPAYQNANLDIYTIEPVAAVRPFLFLGSGWYDLESSGQRKWRWMSDQAEVWIVNPERTVQTLSFEFTTQSYQEARWLAVMLDGQPAATYTIAPALQTIRLQLALPPGEHTLHLTSSTTEDASRTKRNISLAFLHMILFVRRELSVMFLVKRNGYFLKVPTMKS